ncbi:hypothetical protein BTR23_18585 [Alkalihalophilus pseudofirmus]|nr:hypothetical protein BTR23_18585 [Alkalihalophilus pseudofirmus]
MESLLSHFNEKARGMNFPDEIVLCDVTIRDGEQTPGVSFTLDEKIEFVKILNKMGVPQIQLRSLKSDKDVQEAEAICNLNLASKIEIMSVGTDDSWQEQIQGTINCGADIIHSFLPMSNIIRNIGSSSLTDKQIFERAENIVNYTRKNTNKPINISLLDATRADTDFLLKMVENLAYLGVDRIRVADTAGVANPEGFGYLIEKIKEYTSKHKEDLIIGIHCHNDFGLALSNVIAGVKAGATLVDVSVNGLGERAGNSAFEEVVTGLEMLYNVKTNIRLGSIMQLSKYVEEKSNFPIPTNKPFVGKHVFADGSDSHVKVKQKFPLAFQGIQPELVGNKNQFVIGKQSGLNTIKLKCEELRLNLPSNDQYEEILNEIRTLCENNKGMIISDDEFTEIYEKYVMKSLY